jgi:hypothetical protein
VTGVTWRRSGPAGHHPAGRHRAPVPERPALTTPPRHAGDRRKWAAGQPWLGLGGLVLAAVVFFALALGTGNTATSMVVLAPIATFGLAGVAMVAFWWNDWPGSRLTTPWTGLLDTVIVAVLAVVLTIAGQAIVERPDIGAVFNARPGSELPTTFPATMSLAGATFVAMLQLVLVCERWPLSRLKRLWSGLAALVVCWAVGIGAYFLFVNVSYLPAIERVPAGIHDPGGPIPRVDFGAALIAVGVWQTIVFIGLRGWPINKITKRSFRLLAGNALIIVLGGGTYAAMRAGAGLAPALIGAICGCVLAGVLVAAMLFESWPGALLKSPGAGRVVTLAISAAAAVVFYYAMAAYANSVSWIRGAPNDWITSATLSFAGVGIILHVAVGLRWPFAGKVSTASQPTP